MFAVARISQLLYSYKMVSTQISIVCSTDSYLVQIRQISFKGQF